MTNTPESIVPETKLIPNKPKVKTAIVRYTTSGSLLVWATYQVVTSGSFFENIGGFICALVCYTLQKQDGTVANVKKTIGDSWDLYIDDFLNSVLYTPTNKVSLIKYLTEGKIDPRISCDKINRPKYNALCDKNYCFFGPSAYMTKNPEEIHCLDATVNFQRIRGLKPLKINLFFRTDGKTSQLTRAAKYEIFYTTLSMWSYDKCHLEISPESLIKISGKPSGFVMIPRFFLPTYKLVHVQITKKESMLELEFDTDSQGMKKIIKDCALTTNKISNNKHLKDSLFFCQAGGG